MSDSPSEPTAARPRHDEVLGLRPRSASHAMNTTKRWRSDRLLDGQREVVIEHAGQEYRLRRTMNDKLILTK